MLNIIIKIYLSWSDLSEAFLIKPMEIGLNLYILVWAPNSSKRLDPHGYKDGYMQMDGLDWGGGLVGELVGGRDRT